MAEKKLPYMFEEFVTLMFPDLFDPKPFTLPNGTETAPKFSAQFLLDPASKTFKRVKELIVQTALEAFGNAKLCRMPLFDEEDKDAELKAQQNPGRKHCLLDGNRIIQRREARAIKHSQDFDLRKMEHLKDKFVLVARSGLERPPHLTAIVNGHPVDFNAVTRPTAQAHFFPGALVVPSIMVSAYETFGGGVNAYLQTVFTAGEGERMGGHPVVAVPSWYEQPSDDFTGSVPAKKPAFHDDEIPF